MRTTGLDGEIKIAKLHPKKQHPCWKPWITWSAPLAKTQGASVFYPDPGVTAWPKQDVLKPHEPQLTLGAVPESYTHTDYTSWPARSFGITVARFNIKMVDPPQEERSFAQKGFLKSNSMPNKKKKKCTEPQRGNADVPILQATLQDYRRTLIRKHGD